MRERAPLLQRGGCAALSRTPAEASLPPRLQIFVFYLETINIFWCVGRGEGQGCCHVCGERSCRPACSPVWWLHANWPHWRNPCACSFIITILAIIGSVQLIVVDSSSYVVFG